MTIGTVCSAKVAYPTRTDALAQPLAKVPGVVAFRCALGEHYHLGNRRKGRRSKRGNGGRYASR